VRLSAEAARWLLSRAWPRNIRELKQCLVAACVLADSGSIELSHLSHALARPPAANSARARDSGDGDPSDEARHTELLRLFREHRGNVTQVARALGKARVQVQRWMKRFDIDPDKFRE
jgi:transcriptional regulator of acetoin/glycerol metabolism